MRSFLIAALVIGVFGSSAFGQLGKRYASERRVVKDAQTGLDMIVLTNGAGGVASDAKIYQTHPQWTMDGKWIIFRSSGRVEGSQAFAVNEASGEIVQLTDGGANTGTLNIARKSMKLYYIRSVPAGGAAGAAAGGGGGRGNQGPSAIAELDLAKLFADSEKGVVKERGAYERICGILPGGLRESGGFGLDADEKFAYIGVRGGDTGTHLAAGVAVQGVPEGARMGAGPAGIRSMNLETGEVKVIIDTPFQMGHVQTNPWVAGEIIYCHETGGDAAQRMWTVKADGTGNRPLFKETALSWVTHEAVISKDEVIFNLIGHQQRLRAEPTGIAIINLRTNYVDVIGQLDETALRAGTGRGGASPGGFWHCNGSADGRWAAGDTFAGNMWLIDRKDGQKKLLSTDHKMQPDHCHPTFDDASTKILIQSGHFSNGERLCLIVLPIPQGMLAKKY